MTASSLQPKLLYLARRHPALGSEGFTARWREHGALGMSLPRWRNISRYVHCDVLCLPHSTAPLDFTQDGIGMIWHRSPQARAAHLADGSSRALMEEDEQRTFEQPIGETCVVTRETVLIEPRRLPGVRKLFGFWDEASPPRDGGASAGDALAAAGVEIRGHVVNAPLPPEGGSWGLASPRIEEWWFADEESALRSAPVIRAAVPAIGRLFLTNEVVLYDP